MMIPSSLGLLTVVTFLGGAVHGQEQTQYTIDPTSVPSNTRDVWCNTQMESCPLICEQTKPGTTLVNTCDADTLTYGCLCGDNKKPNMSEYSMTIPFFVCQEWGNQCVNGCAGGDNLCASSCREDHPCGAQNPERHNATTTTAAPTASQTGDDTTIYSGPGSSDDDGNGNGDGDSAAVAMVALGRTYGLGVVVGSLALGFAML